MILSKKDTPKQYHGMWYAALLNLCIGFFNLSVFVGEMGGWVNLFAAIFSVTASIVMFLIIKRQTVAILWAKMKKTATDT